MSTANELCILTANELCILTATLDDWDSVLVLLSELNDTLGAADLRAVVVVIDDGSSVFVEPEQFPVKDWANITEVRVVTLYRNLGNQRAVSVGLGYIATELPGLPVVVMDADLEDQPKYLPALVEKMRESGNKIVFAERSERSEGQSFKVFYGIYQRLYKMLTGLPISIGNYSAIPAKLVPRVASISEIASHFPAGIMRARVPYTTIHSVRGTRRCGESKMRLVSLIIHGLSICRACRRGRCADCAGHFGDDRRYRRNCRRANFSKTVHRYSYHRLDIADRRVADQLYGADLCGRDLYRVFGFGESQSNIVHADCRPW